MVVVRLMGHDDGGGCDVHGHGHDQGIRSWASGHTSWCAGVWRAGPMFGAHIHVNVETMCGARILVKVETRPHVEVGSDVHAVRSDCGTEGGIALLPQALALLITALLLHIQTR